MAVGPFVPRRIFSGLQFAIGGSRESEAGCLDRHCAVAVVRAEPNSETREDLWSGDAAGGQPLVSLELTFPLTFDTVAPGLELQRQCRMLECAGTAVG